MAEPDPNSGFCPRTKTYYSLRPIIPLPPPSQPLSLTQYAFSLLRSSTTTTPSTTFLINATTGESLSYGDFLHQVNSLSLTLSTRYSLSKGHVAFILSPSSLQVPVIYFSLLSLGVVISPVNPLASNSEISHQIHLSKPSIALATSHTSHKLPSSIRTILIDSPEFVALSTKYQSDDANLTVSTPVVHQSDLAAILFSSGTTGKVKGVLLNHRNFIVSIAGFYHLRPEIDTNEPLPPHPVSLFTLPLFHVFGLSMLMRAATLGESLVFMERFDFETMLKAVEKYKVTYMPVSPPLIVAFVKSELTKKYDISSLQLLACGGAPLGKEVAEKFKEKFPNVEIAQGYGLTESGAGAARTMGPDEMQRYGSVGRLTELMEAKIVDPATGEALPPGQRGELWLRGPTITQGYIGDEKATSETFDSEGWLKTGDLCYFDSDGFLYIVDRLKELIKYKAYQVPPAELEHLLQSHPEIADAAVIPYPDEEAGQIPMAFVVRKPGSNITEAQVMAFIAKQVAPYKKIRRVAFINAIPKSPAGKILRRELGYGLTESGGVAASIRGPDEAKRFGSVGRLSEQMEAKIVDPVTGEALPPGQKGELWLRGTTIMKGYVGDEKATAETFDPEGWLKTGDLCYFDSDGFLFIVDRLKELIKYKGYQVPPAELEHLLQSNPEIADAAVIPYRDEEAGQIPMAFVVRKPGSSITEAQVMAFIAKQVAPYKKIRRVAFVNSIPKSPAGKILRRELVAHAHSGNLSKL